MDHFGIGAGIRGSVSAYLRCARSTGRTTSLVESVKEGDRVVFSTMNEATRVHRLCLYRKVKIECVVVDPREPHRLFEKGPSQGRTLFDHAWVEQYYLEAIDKAYQKLDSLELELSGYQEEFRRDNKRREEEISRWEP